MSPSPDSLLTAVLVLVMAIAFSLSFIWELSRVCIYIMAAVA
jgi:hypothetical protein